MKTYTIVYTGVVKVVYCKEAHSSEEALTLVMRDNEPLTNVDKNNIIHDEWEILDE